MKKHLPSYMTIYSSGDSVNVVKQSITNLGIKKKKDQRDERENETIVFTEYPEHILQLLLH